MKTIASGEFDPNIWFDYAKARRQNKTEISDILVTEISTQIRDQGFNATTDFPACLFYEELMKIDPEVKVILSIRSNGESWADSVLGSIGRVHLICERAPFKYSSFFSDFSGQLNPLLWESIGIAPYGTLDCTKSLNRDALINAYYEWIDMVKKTVPTEKLLIHNSVDGFEPICKHLGIRSEDCPKEYPRLNDKESIKKKHRLILMIPYIFWALVAIFSSFV